MGGPRDSHFARTLQNLQHNLLTAAHLVTNQLMLDDYANALGGQSPGKALEVLSERVANGKRTNEHVASWIHALSRLMERHAGELESMLHTHQLPETELGTLSQSWHAVAAVAVEQARSSGVFSRRLATEVEKPIKRSGAETDSAAQGLLSELNELSGSSWETQCHAKISEIQSLDLQRLTTLRDSLTRMQTLQADASQSVSAASEKAVKDLLTFDPSEDVQSFVAQVVSGTAPVPHGGREPRNANARRLSHQNRQVSHGSLRETSSVFSNTSSKRKSTLRTRVGSIFGRRGKNRQVSDVNAPSPVQSETRSSSRIRHSESPSVHSRSESAGFSTRPPDFGLRDPPSQSLANNAREHAPVPPPQRRPTDDLEAVGSDRRDRRDRVLPSVPEPQPSAFPETLGSSQAYPPLRADQPGLADYQSNFKESEPPLNGAQPYPMSGEPRIAEDDELADAVSTIPAPHAAGEPRNRREIHSALFAGMPDARVENDTTGTRVPEVKNAQAFTTSAAPEDSWYTPAQQFNPTFDSRGESKFSPAGQLFGRGGARPTWSGDRDPFTSGPLHPHSEVEDRDQGHPSSIRAVGSAPIAIGEPPSAQRQASPGLSRNNSLRNRSLQRNITGDVASAHPEMPSVHGLVSTVLETVQATLKDGVVDSCSLSGEINGAVNGHESQPLLVRFAELGRVANLVPSDAVLVSQPVHGEGVFGLDTTAVSGRSTTLAKYVSSNAHLVPIIFTPMWRVEEKQARLVLSYTLAESYPLDTVVLQNFVIAVSIVGGPAVSAQSKPLATFSKEKQRVTWRFQNPIEVKKGESDKVLCQFTTTSPAHEAPSGIEARFDVIGTPISLALQKLDKNNNTWTQVPTSTATYVARLTAQSSRQ